MSLLVSLSGSFDELPSTVDLVPTGMDGFWCDFCGEHSDAMIAVQVTTPAAGYPDMIEIACTSHLDAISAEATEVKINN